MVNQIKCFGEKYNFESYSNTFYTFYLHSHLLAVIHFNPILHSDLSNFFFLAFRIIADIFEQSECNPGQSCRKAVLLRIMNKEYLAIRKKEKEMLLGSSISFVNVELYSFSTISSSSNVIRSSSTYFRNGRDQ